MSVAAAIAKELIELNWRDVATACTDLILMEPLSVVKDVLEILRESHPHNSATYELGVRLGYNSFEVDKR